MSYNIIITAAAADVDKRQILLSIRSRAPQLSRVRATTEGRGKDLPTESTLGRLGTRVGGTPRRRGRDTALSEAWARSVRFGVAVPSAPAFKLCP